MAMKETAELAIYSLEMLSLEFGVEGLKLERADVVR